MPEKKRGSTAESDIAPVVHDLIEYLYHLIRSLVKASLDPFVQQAEEAV